MSKEENPFTYPNPKLEIIVENELAYGKFDKYPVNKGHALIISKREISNFFDLNQEEQHAMIDLINKVKKILDVQFQPEGYNVGINVGAVAGQTVPHAHIHIIPRYKGDVESPIGGIRNIIPGKGPY